MITAMRCKGGGYRATKVIADRQIVADYDCGTFFSVVQIPVASFDEMAEALDHVSRDYRRFVVRGEPLPGINRNHHFRRYLERHGDTRAYEPAARRVLGIDVDGVAEPAGLDFAQEPEEGIEHVIGLLPDPFADASCWWQATSSAGCKPGIRARLWFWLSRPIEDAECKGWIPATVADHSIWQPVGIHYTAPPIINSGPDPMARRQGIRQGLDDTVEVPAVLPRIERPAPVHLTFTGADPDDATKRRVASVIKNTPLAREIWEGRRDYGGDRSRRHFAFAGALLRGGIFDGFNDDWADCLAFALGKLDERLGADCSKVNRPGYIRRTIEAVVAEDAAR